MTLRPEDHRPRQLQVANCAALDECVLPVQGVEQDPCPAADGCAGIWLVGGAEELRKYRLPGDVAGIAGIDFQLGAPPQKHPQALVVVRHQVVGERCEPRFGEELGHLGHPEGLLVTEDGIEQAQPRHPLRLGNAVPDGIGPRRVVADEDRAGNVQRLKNCRQLGFVVLE